jgi:hypothetical protein
MPYIICEKSLVTDYNIFIPIKNKMGEIIKFKSKRIANEEKIYLQPSYDNLLVIKKEV